MIFIFEGDIVLACAALWNYGILKKENVGFDPDLEVDEVEVPQELEEAGEAVDDTAGGCVLRDAIADALWNRRPANYAALLRDVSIYEGIIFLSCIQLRPKNHTYLQSNSGVERSE